MDLFPADIKEEDKNAIADTDTLNLSKNVPTYQPQSQEASKFMKDPKVIELAKKIDVLDTVAIYDLGKEPADQMTKVSGSILEQFNVADTIGSSKILDTLTKLTKQIDFKELKVEQPKGIKGWFTKVEDVLKAKVAKYQSINGEVNTLFTELKTYENKIKGSIDQIDKLGTANEAYAMSLDQHIALIYVLRNNLALEINETQIKADNGDQTAIIHLPKLQQADRALDKRAYDLEQSNAIAELSAVQLVQTQANNLSLLEQYHSAFIATIPALQTGLVQAVTALQQNYAQQGVNASKQATADLLKGNAERLRVNNKFIAESSGKAIVSIDDMQSIVNTIMASVSETKEIEENNRKQRESDRIKMEELLDSTKKTISQK